MRSYFFVLVVVIAMLGIGFMDRLPAAPPARVLDGSVAKAPGAPDGTTAGAVTDFVVTFVETRQSTASVGKAAERLKSS